MGTKSKQRSVRLPGSSEQYVMEDGTKLSIPSLMGNVPRVSGVRTGNDKVILRSNNGKLSILQR